MAPQKELDSSFEAGVNAAKNGSSINNSYPNVHSEFVKGYKSVSKEAEEDLRMKELWIKHFHEEYKE